MTASSNELSQPKTSKDPKSYEPTLRERGAMEAYFARREARKPAPRIKVTVKKGTPYLSADHPDQEVGYSLLMEALATADGCFLDGLLQQLGNVGSPGVGVDERSFNIMLAMVKGVEPRDQVETMLASQMAAVHNATMTFARRLAHVENIQQQDSAERAFNKLARTFAAQIEALKRYRTGGQQTVTVKQVHVHQGGQAIVGTVTQGGGSPVKTEERAHARQIAHAPEPTMQSADPEREPVPVAGGQRS